MPTFPARGVELTTALARSYYYDSQTHAAAVITLSGVPNLSHGIEGVTYSYSGSGTLSGGLLTIKDGATTVFSMSISSKTQDVVPWHFHGTPGNDLVITLADGGANVDGMISLLGYSNAPWSPGTMAGSSQGELVFGDPTQSIALILL